VCDPVFDGLMLPICSDCHFKAMQLKQINISRQLNNIPFNSIA